MTSMLAAGGSLAAIAVVSAQMTMRIDKQAEAERRVAALAEAGNELYLRTGSFPNNLLELVTLSQSSEWELLAADPYGSLENIDVSVVGDQLLVSSRGPDGQLGTLDDVVTGVHARTAGRARTRNRLRILRAVFSTSGYYDSAMVTPADRATLLQAMTDYTTKCRLLDYVSPLDQAQALIEIGAARVTIESITQAAGLPAVPASATGPGGLLESLGLPDSLGTDGYGHTWVTDVVGINSPGRDGTGGTIDDF